MKSRRTIPLNRSLKLFSAKMIFLGVTVLLLLSSVVFLTVAWYTKMVSVSGLQFHAAKWDFSTNFAVDTIEINVNDYTTLKEKRAAPGTSGKIPLKLSAWASDTAVNYAITIDRSEMSEEFRKRIFFYYKKGETKVYFDGSPNNPNAEDQIMEGQILAQGEAVLEIYWEWIYEAPEVETDETVRLAWDEFDTRVGENPDLFIQDMNAKISIAGVEVNHDNPQKTPTPTPNPADTP